MSRPVQLRRSRPTPISAALRRTLKSLLQQGLGLIPSRMQTHSA